MYPQKLPSTILLQRNEVTYAPNSALAIPHQTIVVIVAEQMWLNSDSNLELQVGVWKLFSTAHSG